MVKLYHEFNKYRDNIWLYFGSKNFAWQKYESDF